MAQVERQLSEQPPQPERVKLGDLSIGIYLPKTYITNEQIEQWGIQTQSGKLVKAHDIQEKIGVKRRFKAGPNESPIEMGVKAALATESLDSVDAVIVSSSYPLGVNISNEIAKRLQINPSFHLDIHAACSGFVLGLTFMKEHEQEFQGKKVLFVATEKYSHTLADLEKGGIALDPSMSQTIFSDGAAASVFTFGKDINVLEFQNEKLPKESDRYILMPIDRTLMTHPYLEEPIPTSENAMLQQDGPKVFEELKSRIPSLNARLIEKAHLLPSDIKLAILHQASGRVVKWLAQRMPDYTFFNDLEDGNFSSASIPKALASAIREGEIQSRDKILLSGFGAGLYASSAIVELG